MSDPALPLAGRLVVDLSSGIAGAYGTRLLADAGAEVVKVEDRGGDPLRRWSASGADLGDDDGALFRFLAGGKASVAVDPDDAADRDRLAALCAAADVIVWSSGSSVADHPDLAPGALHRAHPDATVVAISPFGLDGPWRDRPATEFTVQAWSGGIVGINRGDPTTAPVFVGGQVGRWLAGTYAAIAGLVGMAGAEGGSLIDVALLEAVAACLTYHPVTFADVAGHPFREVRAIPSPGVEQARDGIVGLGTGTGQQWLDLCVLLGHPEWGDDDERRRERWRIAPDVAAWAGDHTVEEILDLTGAFRIPHAPVGNGENVATNEHFAARDTFVPHPGGDFLQPRSPVRFTPPLTRDPEPAPRLGQHTDAVATRPPVVRAPRPEAVDGRPLAGIRVLDLTSFWAGPSCTHALALLGAEVLHVESPTRPDGARMLAGLAFTEDRWWERCGIFSALNTTKSSVVLDLRDERGAEALRRLVATCDVLVENSTPRVLEQLGLGWEQARALRDDLIMVRMPGFGLDGPWRDDPAFAFVVEDAAGLTWMTGHRDRPPISPYCVADPAAGIHALFGVLVALEHRRRTGEGSLVEAAMTDAALNLAAEQVIEHSAYGALLERDGNRGPTACPQNLYRTADGGDVEGWVAVAVATDDQWSALVEALGSPGWATDPALADAAGRRHHQDRIDEELAAWCAPQPRSAIVERLLDAGVPAAPVHWPQEQGDVAPLAERGYFATVDHPVVGPARHASLPLRITTAEAGPHRHPHRRHAPLFGEHTAAVLAELGYTPDEIAALAGAGVTATSPRT